jgi:RNA ligase-like protein
MTYSAKVIQANDLVQHPNADRLQILRYNGEQFVVGKDLNQGDIVVLFPTDGQLSHEFCSNNNLYRHAELNTDKLKTGFFEDNRRVRAQPFRGSKSYGFVAGLESFSFLGDVVLNVGDEFEILNGVQICSKYYTPKTLAGMKANQKKIKDVEYTMKEHIDSEKWSYTKPQTLNENSFVMISEKVHGTSARTSKSKVIHRNLTFWSKLKSFLSGRGFVSEYSIYEHVSGTRRTIINNRLDVTTEGQEDFYRWEWHNRIATQLHAGEAVYYEIVGYNSNGGTIMERQDLNKLKDSKSLIQKTWRNPMIYSYSLSENQNDIYVYRITTTTDDGTVTELSWYQVEARCRELGLKTVPVIEKFLTINVNEIEDAVRRWIVDSSSLLDERHLMEGVVIRIESSEGTKIYKEKNYLFGLLEGYLKESDDYVDTEEIN